MFHHLFGRLEFMLNQLFISLLIVSCFSSHFDPWNNWRCLSEFSFDPAQSRMPQLSLKPPAWSTFSSVSLLRNSSENWGKWAAITFKTNPWPASLSVRAVLYCVHPKSLKCHMGHFLILKPPFILFLMRHLGRFSCHGMLTLLFSLLYCWENASLPNCKKE